MLRFKLYLVQTLVSYYTLLRTTQQNTAHSLISLGAQALRKSDDGAVREKERGRERLIYR